MNENKTAQIKQIIAKIDLDKIAVYLQEYSKSKTLKQINSHKKKALNSSNDQEIFKLAVRLAYHLDTIVNVSKYVKNEQEKKYWLEISRELFENTVGVKDKK
jgi:hypothetical protein